MITSKTELTWGIDEDDLLREHLALGLGVDDAHLRVGRELLCAERVSQLRDGVEGATVLGIGLGQKVSRFWILSKQQTDLVSLLICTGSSKNLAKFRDTCSVTAEGLCISSHRLVDGREAGDSNMQELFCTMLFRIFWNLEVRSARELVQFELSTQCLLAVFVASQVLQSYICRIQ